MTYLAKLIEEASWCIFSVSFQWFHIHIKVWWSV